jgi:hypothetical protein
MGLALGKAGEDTSALERARKKVSWLEKKVWLPKIVYVAIPYFYLACGICAFLATLYVAEWFWLLPHYLLFSFACVHIGIVIFRRRSR